MFYCTKVLISGKAAQKVNEFTPLLYDYHPIVRKRLALL